MTAFDALKIYQDFPILDQVVNDEPLVYLDNAATTQKPQAVLDVLNDYYHTTNANVHRGVHTLAERATSLYEISRERVRQFIHAKSTKEVLFTRGTTTGLNWVARFAEEVLQADDEVLISIMEHHSNLIPWQEACRKTGAKLVYVYLKDGQLDMADFRAKLNAKTKFVSIAHVSNVLGSVQSVKEMAELAHQVEAYMVVDGAQSTPHMAIDVQDLDCDFFAFSGHKMFAPTGIGVLYGKKDLLDKMPPYRLGGEMIANVTREGATWAEVPYKSDAGTPIFAGAIGLGAAIDYLQSLDFELIQKHEQELTSYALEKLKNVLGLTIYGPQKGNGRIGVISFNLKNIHPHDLATALDLNGIEVRAGHHCAQPLMASLDTESTVRASLSIYNTKDDIDKLVSSLHEAKEFFSEFR